MEHIHLTAPALLRQKKHGATFAYYLMFIVSLTGNIVIGIIVYKTKTMRRPTNFFIVNMAMSYMLYLIFVIPREDSKALYRPRPH